MWLLSLTAKISLIFMTPPLISPITTMTLCIYSCTFLNPLKLLNLANISSTVNSPCSIFRLISCSKVSFLNSNLMISKSSLSRSSSEYGSCSYKKASSWKASWHKWKLDFLSNSDRKGFYCNTLRYYITIRWL